MSYSAFKQSLTPRYGVVWRDIALGHVTLIFCAAGLVATQVRYRWAIPLALPIGALVFGGAFAYLNLFFHEAAHWNLARSRRANDFLAQLFVGNWFGQSIASYRTVHFGHHQQHGEPIDTEHSYFDPLNARFVVGALFGLRAYQVARNREALAGAATPGSRRDACLALVRGVLLNGTVVCGSLALGYWVLALAWCAGMLSFFPCFNALRQLLEHRDELADDSANYAEVAHGRINRLFGDSLLAQAVGGAGFNRHLLHHWEPLVSYTRLADVEAFVLNTAHAELFRSRQTTYARAFRELARFGSR